MNPGACAANYLVSTEYEVLSLKTIEEGDGANMDEWEKQA